MSEDLLLGRCPTCGLVKDEMHLYVGRLAHEKVQLVNLLVHICTIPGARKEIDDNLTDEQREVVLRAIEAVRDKNSFS